MEEPAAEIRKIISARGRISFAEFMEKALYLPGKGYYTRQDTEIGRAGDYYTSPHLHPAFGAMLGRQAEEMWEFMGRPGAFDIVEIGGGRGYLCLDMLESLKEREILDALCYTIVELNPALARKQKELLGAYAERVQWVSSLSELHDVRGLVLSNEVLDALPVHVIEISGGLKEVYVDIGGEGFKERLGPPGDRKLEEYLGEFSIDLPEGYRTEVSLALRHWLRQVSSALAEGFVLTIDYGYPAADLYSEERTRGTLLCYCRHRLGEDPFENVGEQDITAHVNFSAVKKWGEEADLKTIGFCPQGTYLVSLGIDELIAELFEKSPEYEFEAARIKGLILPGTIGESHKVLIQYKGKGTPALRGFHLRNRASSL
jgi:SAM-dependent MidA family methyltransferase